MSFQSHFELFKNTQYWLTYGSLTGAPHTPLHPNDGGESSSARQLCCVVRLHSRGLHSTSIIHLEDWDALRSMGEASDPEGRGA